MLESRSTLVGHQRSTRTFGLTRKLYSCTYHRTLTGERGGLAVGVALPLPRSGLFRSIMAECLQRLLANKFPRCRHCLLFLLRARRPPFCLFEWTAGTSHTTTV